MIPADFQIQSKAAATIGPEFPAVESCNLIREVKIGSFHRVGFLGSAARFWRIDWSVAEARRRQCDAIDGMKIAGGALWPGRGREMPKAEWIVSGPKELEARMNRYVSGSAGGR
jgi:hypothetical protein